MQIKFLEFLFIPSAVSVQVFECFVETFDCKLTAALWKYQIEENIRVALEKLLTDEDSSINIGHEKLVY